MSTPIGKPAPHTGAELFQVPTVGAFSGSGSNFKREYRMKALFRFFATVAIALTVGPAFYGQHALTRLSDFGDFVTGADVAFLQNTKVEPRPAATG